MRKFTSVFFLHFLTLSWLIEGMVAMNNGVVVLEFHLVVNLDSDHVFRESGNGRLPIQARIWWGVRDQSYWWMDPLQPRPMFHPLPGRVPLTWLENGWGMFFFEWTSTNAWQNSAWAIADKVARSGRGRTNNELLLLEMGIGFSREQMESWSYCASLLHIAERSDRLTWSGYVEEAARGFGANTLRATVRHDDLFQCPSFVRPAGGG